MPSQAKRCLFAVSAVLGIVLGDLPRAEGAEPDSEPAVEERLKKLEELNLRLLQQYEELQEREARNQRIAEEKYRSLEQKYEELQNVVERRAAVGRVPEPLAVPGADPDIDERTGAPYVRDRPSFPLVPEGGQVPALRGEFSEGFQLETLDEELQLRFHILDQTDFKVFTPNNQSPTRSGLYIPRVRVYFEGRLTRPFEYEVSLQRSVEGVWDLLDGNLNFHPNEATQLQFGRMLVPYSYDWYDHLEQYFITPERGLFPLNFGLSRSAGLMLHGWLADQRAQYAVGGFDGRLFGVADNNTTRDAVGYVNLRPFLLTERFEALRYLNLGGSVFGGQQISPRTPLPLRTSLQSSENDEAAQAASARFLVFNDDAVALGGRGALAVHMAWYYRHLSLEAEWQYGRFTFARAGLPFAPHVPVNGYHATLGYFLTGETLTRRTTVVPLRPVNPLKGSWGPGAIEVFGRYSQLDLGDAIFTYGISDPLAWSNHAHVVDMGFNWYLNRFIKIYVDWQHSLFGSPVLINPQQGLFSRTNDLFWVRCQVYY